MKKHETSKRYLITLLFIGTLLLINSCKKINYLQHGEYHIVNITNYNITFEKELETCNVIPKGTTIIYDTQESRKNMKPADYLNAADFSNPIDRLKLGTINIKYTKSDGTAKCLLKQTKDSINSILNPDKFISEQIGERTYKFTYYFSNSDYNRAVTCP